MPSGRSRVSTGIAWVVVPGMYGTHCKHNPLVSSSVSNNNLGLLIYGCMCVETLGHIHRYMDRMSSNNNKVLISNSLYCFIIWLVYTQITVTWVIRYIDEGFLIWIIPSTYLSHEVVNWACTADFSVFGIISFINFLSVLWYFLSLWDNSSCMNPRYGNVSYRVYIWGFPCFDYFFDIQNSLIHNLSLYN